jgi:hypothetical protein
MTKMTCTQNQLRDLPSPLISRLDRMWHQSQAGMTTAEYAVGTLAACAFAATLLAIVRSGAIKSALSNLITSALSIAS